MNNTSNSHWKAHQSGYLLEIEKSVLEKIEDECRKANDVETGGILIGCYSDDLSTAIITDVTEPPLDSRYGWNWFIRGVLGLKKLLLRKWKHQERTYYIGEWHYHPAANMTPSITDTSQMKKISISKEYQCKEPILLIAGHGSGGGCEVKAFIFWKGKKMDEFVASETSPYGQQLRW